MITKEEVIKIALLARLKLTDTEVEKFQKELSGILDFMKKLDELDTDNVEPLYQVTGLEHVVREDGSKPTTKEIMDAIINLSPHGVADNQYKVPNVL